ncbi:hypothetical protein ACQ4LE_002380 [Meloidogyne hapla]
MFHFFILTKILLFFVGNSPQDFVKGMNTSHPGNDRNVLPYVENPIEFSLTELSFLIEILDSINRMIDLKHNDKEFQEIFYESKNHVLQKHKITNEVIGNIEKITPKLAKIIAYYENERQRFLTEIHKIIENIPNQLNNYGQWNKDDKYMILQFIKQRLNDFEIIMPEAEYDDFLGEENIDTSDDTLNGLSNVEIIDYLNKYKFPKQQEINMFIFYHLLVLARTLIKLFISQGNSTNYYFQLFFYNTHEQISLLKYVQFYDEFEVRGNNLYYLIAEFGIYSTLNLNPATYVKNISHVENVLTQFVSFGSNEYEYSRNIRRYAEIIFTFTRPDTHLWTVQEHAALERILLRHKDNLYKFYYSKYLARRNTLKAKLEYKINENLHIAIRDNIIPPNPNQKKMVNYNGLNIPPQARKFKLPPREDEDGDDQGGHHKELDSSNKRPRSGNNKQG